MVKASTLCARSMLLLCVALGGCSLFNPHIAVQPRTVRDERLAGGLGAAVDQASQLRDQYHAAVGTQSTVRSSIGLALIPIGAAALGLGITGGAKDVITGLGLGGGALYTAGSLGLSTARQRVWLTGSRALGCAIPGHAAASPDRSPIRCVQGRHRPTGARHPRG